MNRPRPKVPELLLEQLHLGEISREDERWLRSQLSQEEIARRLEALRASDRALDQALPAEEQLAAIRGKRGRARAARQVAREPSGLRFALPGLVAAALALLLIWLPSGAPEQALERAPDSTRLKGHTPHLVVHRRVGDGDEVLEDGARVRAGDVLQLGYVAAGARYGAIVSIDGAGAVTLHFPEREGEPIALETTGEKPLSHAYELDAAPAFERFFFVTNERPFALSKVLSAARRLAERPSAARHERLPLADRTLEQSTLLLVKE